VARERVAPNNDRASEIPDLFAFYTTQHDAFFDKGPAGYRESGPGLRPNPYWRCSSLGYCLRRQVMQRAGLPTAEIDEAGRRRMEAGKDLHWLYGLKLERLGLLLGREIAVTDPELSLSGHIDMVWGGEIQAIPERWERFRDPAWLWFLGELRDAVVAQYGRTFPVTMDELKTVADYAFRQAAKDGRADYQLQIGGYFLLARRHPDLLPAAPERGQIVMLNRNSAALRVIPLQEAWIAHAEERVGLLNEAWKTGKWPECGCGLTDGMAWEAKYCPFPNEDGDGCCGQSLLDRLEASLATS
jgi:hypothetical protein